MRFLIAILIAVLLVTLLAKPLKRFPMIFYVIALGLDVLYAFAVTEGMTGVFWQNFIPSMQRCTLAFLLLTIVMFIGVLRDGSTLKAHLNPLRRQLSILACIFAFCHILYYASTYLGRFFSLSSWNVLLSLGLSALLVALLIVLFVTSFLQVKTRMKASSWKKVQRLSYPFYLLIYVHLLLFLLPAALTGKDIAIFSLVFYTIVVGAYVVLRLNRWQKDTAKPQRTESTFASTPQNAMCNGDSPQCTKIHNSR